MSTTIVVLPEAVRGSLSFGHVGDANPTPVSVNAGTPGDYTVSFPSTPWRVLANAGTLHMDVAVERSVDLGATWAGMGGFGGGVNLPGKDGTINDPSFTIGWDGQAMLLRAVITVAPGPFAWGISVTT